MINFDTLPQDNPFALPKPDVYKATITEVEMRTPKLQPNQPQKPDYMNMKYTLTDSHGKNAGSIYDSMYDSDKQVLQFKLGRFVKACGINLAGAMELKDLAKLVKGKTIVVDVAHNTDKDTKKVTAQVDIFTRQGYYPLAEFEEIYTLVHPEEAEAQDFVVMNEAIGSDEERPFDAQDGGAPAGHTEY